MLGPRPEVLKVNNMAEFCVDLVNSRLDAGSGQSSWALWTSFKDVCLKFNSTGLRIFGCIDPSFMRQSPSHNYRLIPNFWNSNSPTDYLLPHQGMFQDSVNTVSSISWVPMWSPQIWSKQKLIKPVITTWGIFVLGARLGLAAAVLQYNSATHVVDYKTVVYFLHKVHEGSPLQKLGLVLPCGPPIYCTSTMTWAVDWQKAWIDKGFPDKPLSSFFFL